MESNEIKIIIQNNCLADQKNLDIQSDNATLTLTARYLQSLLIARSLDRSSYIFLMLQLLYGCDDVKISLNDLAETLSCGGKTPHGAYKYFRFTEDSVSNELRKLSWRGLLVLQREDIKLQVSDLPR